MGKKYDFKYIVIGSGPAGSVVATNLASAKKRVALVESHFFGGSNLNTRDVPYSVALDFAHHYQKMLTFPELKNQDITFNLSTISSRILKTILAAGGNDKKAIESTGVVCLSGSANFLDPHTIAVGNKKFTSENFIIATGAHFKQPEDITIQDNFHYLTPESAIKVRRLPKVIAVVGAGSTGCEIATYFAELGVKVALFEKDSRILPHEDKDVSDLMATHLTKDLGITILPTCKVVALEQDKLSPKLTFKYGNSEKTIRPGAVVLATGSAPTTDLGLENAKVKYTPTGITTNNLFRTSAKHIYAIGDCIGGESSTERAYYQGLTLASNLLNKTKNLLSNKGFVRVTNTSPMIAVLGNTEKELSAAKVKYKKSIINLSDLTAGKIEQINYGFVKLLVDKSGHILGACIVAPHADLIIQELSFIQRHNLTILELAGTTHLINTTSEAIRLAAKNLLNKKKR